LSKNTIKSEELENELAENFLGGSGFGTKMLWDEVPAEVDPLSPENKLIFATGLLTGTSWPSSGRIEVISKSPLTGIYGDANGGGFFAPELKFSGYDMLVFEGKSKSPVYLLITDNAPELMDAGKLWGKGTITTEKYIRKELNDNKVKIASIGPAGENLVRFASIQFTYQHSAARAGMGAVMGHKKLKAIVVRAKSRIKLFDQSNFSKVANLARKLKMKNRFTEGVHRYGTPGLINIVNEIGRLPTKNFQMGSFEKAYDISGETLYEKYFVRHLACYNCPIGCDKIFEVTDGEFRGTVTRSFEYETLSSLGSRCLNNNLASIIKMSLMCDDYGLDTISTGGVISFAMECWAKGIISPTDVGNIDLSWGNYKSMIRLIDMMAHRKGVGNILAEGSYRAAKSFGKAADYYVMHIKKMEIPAQDGRAQQSMGLAQSTSSRGADHLKGFPTIDETGYPQEAIKRYGKHTLPEIIVGTETKYKPLVVKDGEEFCAVIDSVGICKFGTLFPPAIYWNTLAKGIKFATGMKMTVERLKKIGERIVNLQRCYNVLHGITKKYDTQPKRLITEKSPSGRARGHVVYLEKMLKEYYKLRGWDEKTGIPKSRKLQRLGIGYVVDKIKDIQHISKKM
jgi:aldehyde:ferredoxin oxidoreductase